MGGFHLAQPQKQRKLPEDLYSRYTRICPIRRSISVDILVSISARARVLYFPMELGECGDAK